jgi:succinoglycan biosynthesis transport protein ExoP
MLGLDKSRLLDKGAPVEFRDVAITPNLSSKHLISDFISFVGRQYFIIVVVAAIAVVLGGVFIFASPVSYTASAKMIIDSRRIPLFQQPTFGDLTIDSATIDSQAEILKSENIALTVIKELRLDEDPEFTAKTDERLSAIFNFVGLRSYDVDTTRRAVSVLKDNLSVRRVAQTYVIDISFRSRSPDRAAQVANAVVDAYLVDFLEAKSLSNKRASLWLQERLLELRAESSAAQRAVVEFKARNNIVDAGGGRLMNEQQLSEINSQLVLARAHTSETQARLERVQAIINSGNAEATVSDALRNNVIVRLRNQLLDLAKRESDWVERYGPDHLAVVNLRSETREIRKSILDEFGQIAETYKSDFEIAKAREDSIRKSLRDAVAQSETTSQAQVELRELESAAQSYRTLYDSFLQKHMESVQQQSYPVTETRLITHATRPNTNSHPKMLLILAMSALGGIACGFGAATMVELLDRAIRTPDQLESALGLQCLAVLPIIKSQEGHVEQRSVSSSPRRIERTQEPLRITVDKPLSRFTEGVRAIKVAIDLEGITKGNKVIGITSTLPNEGKSTIATNLAQLIAHAGRKVVLDADLRNPSLSRAIAPSARAGLVELVSDKAEVSDVVWTDHSTGMQFVPVKLKRGLQHTNEFMASDAMKVWISHLRQHYDYVIVDLPPLAPVVDVRSSAHLMDSIVLVVEWGVTNADVIIHGLRQSQVIRDKVMGAVLNKVDMSALGRFESSREEYYSAKYYSRYALHD